MKASAAHRPESGAIAWHSLATHTIFSLLVADPSSGLTSAAAAARQRMLHRNPAPRPSSVWRFVFRQVHATLVVVLSCLAIVTALLRLWVDCLVLLALLILNLGPVWLLGRRTKAAAASLRALGDRRGIALRDGRPVKLPASKLVLGDIITVASGDIVPADARLLSSKSLWCSAKPLCRGAMPLAKSPGTLAADTPLARRSNMIHMGTHVVHGSGEAIVVAAGADAAISAVAGPANPPLATGLPATDHPSPEAASAAASE